MTVFGLTDRENDLLEFITGCAASGKKMPTFDEMARHLGIKSKSGVSRLVTSLERKGHIQRISGHARAIRIDGIDVRDAIQHVLANCELSSVARAELQRAMRGGQ